MSPMTDIEIERRRRKLRCESAAANVIRHWLTGEVYEDPPPTEQRRRKYPKHSRQRQERVKESVAG